MSEQILGGYAFEDDPEVMTIPESKKTVASVNTYSSTAIFQWPAQIAGQQMELEWPLMTVAQYEQLRTLYLSSSVITWAPQNGYTYQVVVSGLEGKYNEGTFHHQPYRFDVKLTLHILSATVVPA